MSLFNRNMATSKEFRIKQLAEAAVAKIAGHVASGGGPTRPWIGDVEFKVATSSSAGGRHELTCGVEFIYNHGDGETRNYRIEGPIWYRDGHISVNDINEMQIEGWCKIIESRAHLFGEMAASGALLNEGLLDWSLWGNFPATTNLLVFCWTNEEYEYDDIPWGEILPSGMVHLICPTMEEIANDRGGIDTAMISVGDAVSRELEDRKVMWVQFNNDFKNHNDIRMACRASFMSFPEHLHCLNAESVHEFVKIWDWANAEIKPRLFVLYNPWEAPLYPKDAWAQDMHDPNIKTWTNLLGRLVLPRDGTMIVLNRVPANQIESLNLAPWNTADLIQSFHEESP